MIAGELEVMMPGSGYDTFLGFGKNKKDKKEKRKLTPEEQAAKREKRKNFWSDLDQRFAQGGTVDNLVSLFSGNRNSDAPADYSVSLGDQDGTPEHTPEKKAIPIGLVLGGIVVVLGVGYYFYNKSQKQKLSS